MFEKCNPGHPDKFSDVISGAIVDEAYRLNPNCKIAVEILLGHGVCHIISETSEKIDKNFVYNTVHRICQNDNIYVLYDEYLQDPILASNQKGRTRCGDNGIFKGVPVTSEEQTLTNIAKQIYDTFPYDGKYVLDKDKLIVCQSHCNSKELLVTLQNKYPQYNITVNPLGDWTGSISVDAGAVNRKLGSDMAQSATGGGINGKDISKADVSVNIYCFLEAQKRNQVITASCAIGDESITFHSDSGDTWTLDYQKIVKIAKDYIDSLGGFEKFAEWGLVRPK